MLHPEEIDNQQFEVSFRGYNTREVDEFLNKIRIELEEVIKEQDVLRRKIAAAELIAKEAKDHEEEFLTAMKADKDLSNATLQSSKLEGERIIREAKNAATGIMAEVRRRASEISKESKRASAQMEEEAQENAANIISAAEAEAAALISAASEEAAATTAAAKAEAETISAAATAAAEDKLFSAKTEAENIVKAAVARARVVEEEALQNSTAAAEAASKTAADCEAYITEIRKAADSICRELDIELKNSASRISLLGRRIAAMDVSVPPALNDEDADDAPADETAPEVYDEFEEYDVISDEEAGDLADEADEIAPAEEIEEVEEVAAEPEAEEPAAAEKPEGGYFTKEYRQVMEELFGDADGADFDTDEDVSAEAETEDDDTYDYTERAEEESDSLKKIRAVLEGDFDEDGEIIDTDEVTDEYTGFSEAVEDDESFNTADIDRIYKSPSSDDIDDIMNGF